MKVYEVTQQGRVSKVTPGQSAEIDHGDGTKTVVDLKQNPDALAKDPQTGRVNMSTRNQQNKNNNQSNARTRVRPGDRVDLGNED